MAESLNAKFLELDKNEEQVYESQYDSSDYHPDQFGVGKVTSKVFEEMYDEQDEWETFFTTMFLIGIFMIPLQLIFSDDIKPYDTYIIEKIQFYVIYTNFFIEYCFKYLIMILSFVANIKFFLSVTIFFYLCFDPGVAYKTSLIAGCGSYIVFILKVISHDSRPFWVSANVEPGICKLSFGSPSLDVFVGMLYSHYIFFCTERALMSNDVIINMNRSAIQVSKYVSIFLMALNAFVGVAYFSLGVNFIYQILISFFYGFIIIRIIIIFNKDIDHFANGSRFIKEISNVSSIMVMFFVTILSIISCIIYEIVNSELLIPREWSENISVKNNLCLESLFL
jgi:hypothetical protein